MRAGHNHVQAPFIHLEIVYTHCADGIHHQNRVLTAAHYLAELLYRMLYPGRGLMGLYKNSAAVRVLRKGCLHLCRVHGRAPFNIDINCFNTVGLAEFCPAFPEFTAYDTKGLVPGRKHVAHSSLHAPCARRSHNENIVLGLIDVLEILPHPGKNLAELGRPVVNYRLRHDEHDMRIYCNRPWRH